MLHVNSSRCHDVSVVKVIKCQFLLKTNVSGW